MIQDPLRQDPATPGPAAGGLAAEALAYGVDAVQRCILFADTLRRRGNTYLERAAETAPHVLSFEAELIVDGRTLPRPVNYGLVRIVPPKDVVVDRRKRPFIVFDPRAGHGPGIGGMKQDSEIGVALRAGHPCYFVGFLTEPVPGQTIEDVCRAEGHFIEAVIAREPHAQGRPCLVGNCQAGWQIMLTAAIRPDLAGPVILAGSPLSYWAGQRGRAPMRYLGGLLGGTWLTALAGDLGHGIFDGANLVANFESMNPANTYWEKAWNVYSRIDTEPARFLDFETWWGSPVLLTADEMNWIADNLFVGNRLAEGAIATSRGDRVDLRNVTSPIVVFCSWGDDITPPQQALGWVLDLYDSVDEIVLAGQTIVYTVHQSIGHLGIFVSGKVAAREHSEFASGIDMIDMLPPGLYEAVITDKSEDMARPDLVEGPYLLSIEPRTLDDIRAFGFDGPQDQRRFATVARVSEINKGLYRTFAQPLVRAATTEGIARAMRDMHPHRLRFSAMSDRNPGAASLAGLAEAIREDRRPVEPDNAFHRLEAIASDQIAFNLKLFGQMRDLMCEQVFLATYGNPILQALVGLRADESEPRRSLRDVVRETSARKAEVALEHHVDQGDGIDAVIRAMLYITRAARRGADERGFAVLKALARETPPELRMGPQAFKKALRRQFLLLRQDEARAMAALPALLPADPVQRRQALGIVHALFESRDRTADEQARLEEIDRLFAPASLSAIGHQPAA